MLGLSLLVLSAASGALSFALAPRTSPVPTEYFLSDYVCPAVTGKSLLYVDHFNPLERNANILYCAYADGENCFFDSVCPALHRRYC
jgi:hypothetical protein